MSASNGHRPPEPEPEPADLVGIRVGLARIGTVQTARGKDRRWRAYFEPTPADRPRVHVGIGDGEAEAIRRLWARWRPHLEARTERLRAASEARRAAEAELRARARGGAR